jgi:MFS family permease
MTASSRRPTSPAAGRTAFAVLLLLVVFNFADQSLLSPLLNPLLRDFFGTAADVVPLGWVTFTFTALSALAMIGAGFAADRVSRLRLSAAGAAVYGLVSALAFAIPHGRPGYALFFLMRALAGLGAGVIIPAVFSIAGDLVAADRRATAFGFMSVAILTGRMAGFGLGGGLAGDWRQAYVLVGAVNLALAAALLLLREPPRGGQERELRDLVLEGAAYRFRLSRRDLGFLRSARSNVWLVLNFIDVLPGSIIIFLIFKYMKDVHNMGPAGVDFAIVIVFVAGAAGAVVFGRVGDLAFRREPRAKVLVALFSNSVPIAFMILFLVTRVRIPDGASLGQTLSTPGTWGLILTIAAAMFINQGVNPNWYSTLTDVNLPEHRAAMIALASVADLAGNALGPLIGSYVATLWGLRTAMASVLVFWIINIFFWLPVLRHVRGDLGRIHGILEERAEAMLIRAK